MNIYKTTPKKSLEGPQEHINQQEEKSKILHSTVLLDSTWATVLFNAKIIIPSICNKSYILDNTFKS
jgi:hypothetical protein